MCGYGVVSRVAAAHKTHAKYETDNSAGQYFNMYDLSTQTKLLKYCIYHVLVQYDIYAVHENKKNIREGGCQKYSTLTT